VTWITENPIIRRLQVILARTLRIRILRKLLRALMRALRVSTTVRQHIPVEGTFEIRIREQRLKYHSSFADGLGRILCWSGPSAFEPETLPLFLDRMEACRCFLDVGANTGFYSMAAAAANPTADIHAFEPSPSVFAALKTNIAANRLEDSVVCRRLALSDFEGDVCFHVPNETLASGSLDTRGVRGIPGHVETVPCRTLDAYVAEHELFHVDLLKLDVEGFEDRVIAGARALLSEHRPAVICECHHDGSHRELENLLRSVDYTIHRLTASGPNRVARIETGACDSAPRFLFVPREAMRHQRPTAEAT
jgi:FkbM family methyltransferase